ncbi:MAG: hypothetical protein U9P07_03240 [Pseudomonadota bacterium]|nr:hypothetical protein [Pseudomonadota bacterium]
MRNFKKIAMTFLVVMVVMAGTLPVSAGQGRGQGLADGSGPMVSIYDGESVNVVGKVAALPAIGDPGLKIDDGAEIITVYGIGSSMVWEALGYEPLTVGEEVTIAAYEVTFIDESTKLIAVAVTVGEQTIPLRDEEGRPIWRRGAMGGGGNGSQDGNMGAGQRLHDGSCLQ